MFACKRILSKFNVNFQAMNVFTQKLNPITGVSDWIVQNENYDYHQEVARSSFADMLHDTERNKKYERALKSAINHMHAKGKKANVLDIGTGTGLLSMMAVRNGADSVIACEAFEPMSECAKKVIKLNGFDDKIVVIAKRSTELKLGEDGDIKSKVNILVTEVFDTELIGEGALNTFNSAHEFLLEDDCVVIPRSATMFAQVVESPFVQNWNKLKDVYDEEGEALLKVPDVIKECPGAIAVHDVQLSQLPLELFNTIVPPQPIFEFDWSGKKPLIYERNSTYVFQATRDGTAQAVFMWWELTMDVDETIKLSCAPFWAHSHYKKYGDVDVPWRDHWMQAIYYLPNEIKLKKGDELTLVSHHDEFSVWFDLYKIFEAKESSPPFCTCNLHLACPRTRIGQMNDGVRTKRYLSALRENVTDESVVLVLSHGFHLGLCAAKMGAKKVVCVEPSMLMRSFLKSFVDYNKLDVEIVESPADLSEDLKINLIFGEPYFNTSILPWDNLMFVYLIKEVRRCCVDDVKIVPESAVIRGVAVEFKDLHKIRSPLGECEGFSMKPFDDLIQSSSAISDDNIEAQPLWEYPCIALSEPVDIATIDLTKLLAGQDIDETANFKILPDRDCNGVALWVDWRLDDEKKVVSTGPVVPIVPGEKIQWNMHVRQGVHLINDGRTRSKSLVCTFKFRCAEGHVDFRVS